MGRQRTPRQAPVADTVPTRFSFEPDGHGGITVMRDGHPQSHVVLDDPRILEFEYVQHFALVLDALHPAAPASLGITHIGGAGLTLARYAEATRPGSPQIVLEPDTELTEAVRRELPLPRNHRIRVRGADGASGLVALKDNSADVVVLDAFADGRVPAELVAPDFAAQITRVLKPGGVFLANLSDEPGFAWAARAIATITAALPHATVIAAQEVLKGRRFGNVVLAASATPDAVDVDDIRRRAARAVFPTGVRSGDQLTLLCRDALPFTTETALRSPVPPQLGAWRVR